LENLTELEEEKKEAEQDIRNVEAGTPFFFRSCGFFLQNFLPLLIAELKALMVDGEKPKTDKQMREYMHTLAAKTNQYKQSKAELQVFCMQFLAILPTFRLLIKYTCQASRDEVQVLMRTEELLRSRVDNIEVS